MGMILAAGGLLVVSIVVVDGLICAHEKSAKGFSPLLCFIYALVMLALPIGAAVTYREYWIAFMVAFCLKLFSGAAFFAKEGVSMITKSQHQKKHQLPHKNKSKGSIDPRENWLRR